MFRNHLTGAIPDTTVYSMEGITALSAIASRHDRMDCKSSSEEIQDLLVQSPQSLQPAHVESSIADNAPIDLNACISSAAPESVVSKLDIARFAFEEKSRPRTVSKTGVSLARQHSNATTSGESASAAEEPKRIKNAFPMPSFASSFTARQLAGLSRCFICNLAWTVRKTVPVKLSHIKSCARKNGWKEETTFAGMTKEIGHVSTIASADVIQGSRRKGKGKAVEDPMPKTFLEDVVNGAAPKKTRKKVQDVAVVTVLNPQDAHAAIKERAKTLLALPLHSSRTTQNEQSFLVTQNFSSSNLGTSGTRGSVVGLGMLEDRTVLAPTRITSSTVDAERRMLQDDNNEIPPTTQSFRPSTLAGKSTKGPTLHGSENANGERLSNGHTTRMLPSATQAFRPSELAAKFGQSKQSLHDKDEFDTLDYPVSHWRTRHLCI